MTHDCGHVCCDERSDPLHDHFLGAADCPRCAAVPPALTTFLAEEGVPPAHMAAACRAAVRWNEAWKAQPRQDDLGDTLADHEHFEANP